ncbi:hypothetical protein NDU88_000407 [Pleurodeles waltl]|uniref:Uncharacterized protein n=1 Tax=Pleurodeles waltl TaxID=8319 RepID=A0AAV7N9I5_PLEWA|nr:hypothetical protein NDU88_000407 [Pleurodeles waltl]
MTDWVPFEKEEYRQYYEAGQFLGDGLSEAINASVQQSVNRALEAPFATMTDWVPFEKEEYRQYYEAGQFLGDGLSEAINASVQQSVNRALEAPVPLQISQALVVALKLFTQQLKTFAKTQSLIPLS